MKMQYDSEIVVMGLCVGQMLILIYGRDWEKSWIGCGPEDGRR